MFSSKNALSFLFLSSSLYAAYAIWIGNAGSVWNDLDNWIEGVSTSGSTKLKNFF